MTTTYSWNISQLECYPEQEGQTNVVSTIHWQCNGTDGTYNASVYATASVTLNPDAPYTPYEDLTQEQILGWIWESGVDKDTTEKAVGQQIENMINPPIVRPPLPWSSQQI